MRGGAPRAEGCDRQREQEEHAAHDEDDHARDPDPIGGVGDVGRRRVQRHVLVDRRCRLPDTRVRGALGGDDPRELCGGDVSTGRDGGQARDRRGQRLHRVVEAVRLAADTTRPRACEVSVFACAIWLFVSSEPVAMSAGANFVVPPWIRVELRFEEELPAHQRRSQRRRLPLDREVVVARPGSARCCPELQRRKNDERCRGDDGGDECTEGEDS